jgi:predicted amidohydrolase
MLNDTPQLILAFIAFFGCIPSRASAAAPATVKVAAIQAASEFGAPDRNRQMLADLVRRAADNGASIAVLPETAVTGYLSYDLKRTWQVEDRSLSYGLTGFDPRAAAETVPGLSTALFAKLAAERTIYVSVPLVEIDRKTGRYYNTVVLLGPDGRQLIHYRKLNPWWWAERGWATAGNLGHPVVDTPFGRLGVLICFDIHEQARAMRELKVDILLYSIAWVDRPNSDWFAKQLPEVARRNDFSIVGANWTIPADTTRPAWSGYGQSLIIGRDGGVLAKARRDMGGEIVFAELPVAAPAEASREALPAAGLSPDSGSASRIPPPGASPDR